VLVCSNEGLEFYNVVDALLENESNINLAFTKFRKSLCMASTILLRLVVEKYIIDTVEQEEKQTRRLITVTHFKKNAAISAQRLQLIISNRKAKMINLQSFQSHLNFKKDSKSFFSVKAVNLVVALFTHEFMVDNCNNQKRKNAVCLNYWIHTHTHIIIDYCLLV
jgi:hypothetical protein